MVMHLYCVVDSFEDQYWGPFSTQILANKVLSIVKQVVDDEATIHPIPVDRWAAQLNVGLLPWRVDVMLVPGTGQIREKEVSLTWPPAETEGVIAQIEDSYISYFVWAKSQTEALTKLARLAAKRPAPTEPEDEPEASEWSDRRQATRTSRARASEAW